MLCFWQFPFKGEKMNKKSKSEDIFDLSPCSHAKVYKEDGEIVQIRIIKKVGMGRSFINLESKAELMDFIGQLSRMEQML
jgi:hypothetical protein